MLPQLLLAWLFSSTCLAQTLGPNDGRLPNGYHEWTLARPDGSTLFFYSNFDRLDSRRPLAVWMQGSGYHSVFPVREGQTRLGPMSLVAETLGPNVQVLTVEKRGVEFGLLGKGSAEEAPPEYHEHATLEGRSADVTLALESLQKQGALPARLLAIGHSEGADVAAKVAADYPAVTHVAFLAGGGPGQIYDFMVLVRREEGSPEEKETRIKELWKTWADIQSDPLSTVKMFQGHAYRRWSSYFSQPPVENLKKTRARILVVHGSEDQAVPIESADLCSVELTRSGLPHEYLRLPGADHSLLTPTQKEANSRPFLSLSYILKEFFLSP